MTRAAKKPPMQSFARLIAGPGHDGETVFELPSRAVCVGDPLTDFGGRTELGVTSAAMFFVDLGFDHESTAIAVRARPTVAVRWELGLVGGVDSGVFGVWDADTRAIDGAPGDGGAGACMIAGRRVFALPTGDGGFPCVVGFDDTGAVCALVAGPGVDPKRFAATLREEHMTPEERAERDAREARNARLRAQDFLGARLGEQRASAPLRWFVAGWLDSLAEADRAVVREKLEPAMEGLALPRSAKKAKERVKEDMTALLAWAVSGWARILAPTMPEEAGRLRSVEVSIDKKKMGWADVLHRIFDNKMTARRFDLRSAYEARFGRRPQGSWPGRHRGASDGESAIGLAYQDVPSDLAARLGIAGLDAMTEKTEPHGDLADALWYASAGLGSTLRLHVLAIRAADLVSVEDAPTEGAALLRPRDPGYVEELLATLETPMDLLLRLAKRV